MGKTVKTFIIDVFYGILEVIYPRENYCIICGENDCFGLCKSCRRKINISNSPQEDNIVSYGYYGGILKELILKFKYKSDFTAGDILAELLEEYIIKNIDYEDYVLTYIPLSKKSKRIRGFNQCEYIAKKISRDLCIDVLEILIKEKETKEQKKLKKEERRENVKDAFNINKNLKNKEYNIILIDDVVTTGATIMEAYSVLKKYGANNIKVLTLAKSHI